MTDGTELQDFRLTLGVCTYLAVFACVTILGMNPVVLLCYKDVSDPSLTSFLVSHWENITEERDTCRVCEEDPQLGGCFAVPGEMTKWKERLLWSKPRKGCRQEAKAFAS